MKMSEIIATPRKRYPRPNK
jgi:hypothetical protein